MFEKKKGFPSVSAESPFAKCSNGKSVREKGALPELSVGYP